MAWYSVKIRFEATDDLKAETVLMAVRERLRSVDGISYFYTSASCDLQRSVPELTHGVVDKAAKPTNPTLQNPLMLDDTEHV